MKPASEWNEEHVLSLPHGEFDWLEVKGRRAIDMTLPSVKESDVLENLAKEISAFANSGGGQIVFGLANPSKESNKWQVDDGGISNSIKGNTNTREWLEDVIPNLVEYPLAEFNVYSILPTNSESQISSGRALYVIDIADSSNAPHQSKYDNKYYARVGGKSRPINHRMIVDIIGRRQYPKIEPEFTIERKFIKGKPQSNGLLAPPVYLPGYEPPLKDTYRYTLMIRARNKGRVYANYVNSFILVPVELLPSLDVRFAKRYGMENINNKFYVPYNEDNTVRDLIRTNGFNDEYGPSRYKPILPGLSHRWKIPLRENNEYLKNDDLFIRWTVYADNALSVSSEIKVKDIDIVDVTEPGFKDIAETEE